MLIFFVFFHLIPSFYLFKVSHSISFQKYHRLALNLVRSKQSSNDDILHNLFDLADWANYCDSSKYEMLTYLSHKRSNISIIQREIPEFGIRYNIIKYEDDFRNEKKLVISIRGTKNVQNLQSDFDSRLVKDNELDIEVHQGFKNVYKTILSDIFDKTGPVYPHLHKDLLQNSKNESNRLNIFRSSTPTIHITGHSLGKTESLSYQLHCTNVNEYKQVVQQLVY